MDPGTTPSPVVSPAVVFVQRPISDQGVQRSSGLTARPDSPSLSAHSPHPSTSQPGDDSPAQKEKAADVYDGPDYYTSDEDDEDPAETESRLPPKQAAKRRRLREERDQWKPKYYYGEKEAMEEAARQGASRGWSSKGTRGVPVFEPTMEQFRDFNSYIRKIDHWGMRSGVVKIIPPRDWIESLPNLGQESLREDGKGQMLKEARIKSPITQVFHGSRGLYRVMNVTKSKTFNPLQWYDLANSPDLAPPDFFNKTGLFPQDSVSEEHVVGARSSRHARVPPRVAKVLERRVPRTKKAKAPSASESGTPAPQEAGHNSRAETPIAPVLDHISTSGPTPVQVSPVLNDVKPAIAIASSVSPPSLGDVVNEGSLGRPVPRPNDAMEVDLGGPHSHTVTATATGSPAPPQTTEPSVEGASESTVGPDKAVRKQNKPQIDPESWKEYVAVYAELPYGAEKEEYTVDACKEIERQYWRTITMGKEPVYGADSKGSLFDERTTSWNIAHLDNLLNRLKLKQKIPGVNTPYLYFGAWRATFAWHVEDADLYSINFIHFGAPKFWYTVPQEQNERFERFMAAQFAGDLKTCPQFLRHKAYLASPSPLANAGITVNKVVQLPGEIILTYPYGYHSGFNMGYNCAESVNFATEEWVEIGRKARACTCIEDTVRIDIDAWLLEHEENEAKERLKEEERKARRTAAAAASSAKRKREAIDAGGSVQAGPITKKVMVATSEKVKLQAAPKKPAFVCAFCPDMSEETLVRVIEDNMSKVPKRAHKVCCMFIPATWIETLENGEEVARGFAGIEKARWALKCQLCSEKMGVKVQCTKSAKCARACHVTCGLRLDSGWIVDARLGDDKRFFSLLDSANDGPVPPGIDPHGPVNLAVHCRQHNDVWIKAEQARKARERATKIFAIPIGTRLKVRTSGVFEVTLVDHLHDAQRLRVRFDNGHHEDLPHSKMIWDAPRPPPQVTKDDPYIYDRVRPSINKSRVSGSNSGSPSTAPSPSGTANHFPSVPDLAANGNSRLSTGSAPAGPIAGPYPPPPALTAQYGSGLAVPGYTPLQLLTPASSYTGTTVAALGCLARHPLQSEVNPRFVRPTEYPATAPPPLGPEAAGSALDTIMAPATNRR